jgi:hypothetical protein
MLKFYKNNNEDPDICNIVATYSKMWMFQYDPMVEGPF